MDPTPTTTQRGAHAPLWKPPHNLRSLCSTVEAPRRACPPGVRRSSVFANGENLGARADSFRPRRSNLEGSPDSPQDWLGGFQRGRAPFESSRKRGSRGRNPIERVSPSVWFFGDFLSTQKVTRGVGPGRPHITQRYGAEGPETISRPDDSAPPRAFWTPPEYGRSPLPRRCPPAPGPSSKFFH